MVNSLLKFINNDKFMHFVYGIAICALMQPFGVLVSLLSVLFIGVMKEVLDKKSYSIVDVKDALFTLAGGFFLVTWYGVISYVQRIIA